MGTFFESINPATPRKMEFCPTTFKAARMVGISISKLVRREDFSG
jgi:hypothetical protein